MLTRLRARLTYANVMSTLAVVLALGGTAVASTIIMSNGQVAKNTISGHSPPSGDHPNIIGGSIKGTDIAPNSITGGQISESTLGTVPSASTATNALKLGGQPASAYASSTCPTEMVRVGATCIDRYEDSVWSSPNGGTQYGVSSADYPCNANGNDCKGRIYARSVPGVQPSAYITWFQAEQALADSGKRLPTNAEWQQAAAGTPEPGPTPGPEDCNTNSSGTVVTGSRVNCVSAWGAYDMVGNLWEWVADWVPLSTSSPGWGGFSTDVMGLAGASTSAGPGALIRGFGYAGGPAGAGPFSVAVAPPSEVNNLYGFRGAR